MRKSIKHKILTLFLGVSATACLAVGTACSCGGGNSDSSSAVNELSFEVPQTLTATYGELYTLPEFEVTDTLGNTYIVNYQVYDENKVSADVIDNAFTVSDMNGYTIKSTVFFNGKTEARYTALSVLPCNIPFVVNDVTQRCYVGDTVKLGSPVSQHVNAVTFTYSVYYKTDDGRTEVALSDNKFLAENGGTYTVVIDAKDKLGNAGSYSYNVVCRTYDEAETGLVEKFDENWTGTVKQNYTIVSAEKEGIGTFTNKDVTVAKISATSMMYPMIYLNPVESKEYYQNFADQGFTSVSFWCYVKSSKNIPHYVNKCLGPSSYANARIKTIYPNQWTQLTFNLTDTSEDWQGSFLTAYDRIKSQENHVILFDNSYDWNINNQGGDTMTIYFSDVYVMKNVKDIEYQLPETIELGDTLYLDEIVQNYDGAVFTLNNGETTEVLTGNTYTFTDMGKYTLTAKLLDGAYRGSVSMEFEVISPYYELELTAEDKDVTATNGLVAWEHIGIDFTNNGETKAYDEVEYEVNHLGTAIASDDTGFNMTYPGQYEVTVKVHFTENDQTYTAKKSITFNVYDEDTAYNVWHVDENFDNVHAYVPFRNKTWASDPTDYSVVTGTIGDETGTFYRVASKKHSMYVNILPTFTKSYYQNLLAQYPNDVVQIRYYLEDTAGGYANRSVYKMTKVTSTSTAMNNWYTMEISLADFVNTYYDWFYDIENDLTVSNPDLGANSKVFLGMSCYTSNTEKKGTIYLADIEIITKPTAKNATTNETAQTGTTYNVSDLFNVTFDNEAATITAATLEYAGKTVLLEDGTFTAIFGGDYTFTLTAKAGRKQDKITTTITIGETLTNAGIRYMETGESLTVTDLYTLPDETSFDSYRLYAADTKAEIAFTSDTLSTDIFPAYKTYILEVWGTKDGVESELNYALLAKVEIHYTKDKDDGVLRDMSDGLSGVTLYQWSTKNTSNRVYKEFTVTDKNGTEKSGYMLKAKWAVENIAVQFKPQYTVSYYENLAKANYSLQFSFLAESYYSERTYRLVGDEQDRPLITNTWYTVSVPFSQIVKYYGKMSNPDSAQWYERGLVAVQNGTGYRDQFCVYVTGFEMVKTAGATDSYSYEIADSVFTDHEIGDTIDLTKGIATFNGKILSKDEYEITSLTEEVATVENGILTVKDFGLVKLQFTVKLLNGMTYESITYSYTISVKNEIVDGWGDDTLGEFVTQT